MHCRASPALVYPAHTRVRRETPNVFWQGVCAPTTQFRAAVVPLTQTYLMHDTTSPFFFLVQGFTMLHVGFQAAFFTTTNLPC